MTYFQNRKLKGKLTTAFLAGLIGLFMVAPAVQAGKLRDNINGASLLLREISTKTEQLGETSTVIASNAGQDFIATAKGVTALNSYVKKKYGDVPDKALHKIKDKKLKQYLQRFESGKMQAIKISSDYSSAVNAERKVLDEQLKQLNRFVFYIKDQIVKKEKQAEKSKKDQAKFKQYRSMLDDIDIKYKEISAALKTLANGPPDPDYIKKMLKFKRSATVADLEDLSSRRVPKMLKKYENGINATKRLRVDLERKSNFKKELKILKQWLKDTDAMS